MPDKIKTSIVMDRDFHRKFKMTCVKNETSMKDVFIKYAEFYTNYYSESSGDDRST